MICGDRGVSITKGGHDELAAALEMTSRDIGKKMCQCLMFQWASVQRQQHHQNKQKTKNHHGNKNKKLQIS